MADSAENGLASHYRSHGLNSSDSRDRGRYISLVPETERFWSKVALRAGRDCCWVWLAGLNRSGYGLFRVTISPGVHRTVLAHRYSYQLLAYQIPEGLTLDHLCGERRCVRPSHLEPVTNSENLRRRHARQNGATT